MVGGPGLRRKTFTRTAAVASHSGLLLSTSCEMKKTTTVVVSGMKLLHTGYSYCGPRLNCTAHSSVALRRVKDAACPGQMK